MCCPSLIASAVVFFPLYSCIGFCRRSLVTLLRVFLCLSCDEFSLIPRMVSLQIGQTALQVAVSKGFADITLAIKNALDAEAGNVSGSLVELLLWTADMFSLDSLVSSVPTAARSNG